MEEEKGMEVGEGNDGTAKACTVGIEMGGNRDHRNYNRNRDQTSYNQGNMGSIQEAHGIRNSPSGDPDACIASHSITYQSQDARSGLQSMSGVPDGSEGRGLENLPSVLNAPTIGAQASDTLQAPSTALGPSQPLESIQHTQPVDLLIATNVQPTALESTAAALSQLINTAAVSFGVTLGAPPAQDLLGIEQLNAAMAPPDLAQADAGAGTSVVNAPTPAEGAPIDNVAP